MKKKNYEYNVNETENPNVIRVTETYEIPRYSGKIYDDFAEWLLENVSIREIEGRTLIRKEI